MDFIYWIMIPPVFDTGEEPEAGENPNPSAGTQRDVQTILNRGFDPTNNILNTTTV